MKTFYICFLMLLSTAIFAQDFNSKWSNGFKVESDDRNFKLKFGGRIMVDYAFISQADGLIDDPDDDFIRGMEFRRARFFNSGLIYKKVKYKLQLDFAGGDVSFKDAYIELPKIPVLGDLRIGHFKQPFRLEALTSSKYMPFMERSAQIPFNQERNSGFMFKNESSDKSFGWQLGYFYDASGAGDNEVAGDAYNLTARLSYMPVMKKDENQILLISTALNYKKPEDSYRVRVRPAAHLAPRYLNTDHIQDVDNVTMFNAEVAFIYNSLYFEGAYLSSAVKAGTDVQLSTYYAQLSYFLTGESRKIKSHYDGLDRVKPKNNYGSEDGSGAWEVGLRYSNTNLNDGPVLGGEMAEITIGLNWYLNPATRFMFNYVNADVKDVDNASIFQFRFQIDF